METRNLLEAEFKTLAIRMLNELSEKLNCIKKTQSEMKDTLIEIKNNLQGNNSRMDEAKNQINDWNIRKKHTFNVYSKKKKKNLKNQV